MRSRLIFLLSLAVALIVTSCSPKESEVLVAEYGKYDITLDDFEQAYAKNAGGLEQAKDDSLQQLKNFLDLYVNFKMKLRDSEIRHYDEDPELQAELDDYKRKVGKSYILEKELTEPAIREIYNKRKEEIRISHIMITVDSSKNDSKAVADHLLEQLKNGADWDSLAKRYSSDKFSRETGGDIYYITAGQIIPEIENAAYATQKGEIYPEPVETSYGYHIIKVTDRQPRRGSVKASHILVKFPAKTGGVDTTAAYEKIVKIQKELEEGKDFAEAAKEYSDDPGSAQKGGDLGFFTRRRMVKPFDEAAFKLDVGEVSDIVKTQYGYHLIKVTDEKGNPTFAEEADNLRNMYKKIYYQDDFNNLVDSLKKEFDYKVNEHVKGALVKKLADTLKVKDFNGSDLAEGIKDSVIITYNGNEVIVDSLVSKLKDENQFRAQKFTDHVVTKMIAAYSENALLEEKALMLEQENEEFAQLMEDYRNGIYIFKLQEDEIWNNVKIDSTELLALWEKNKENYTWNDRVDFSEIYTSSDSLARVYYESLQAGAEFDSLASEYTDRRGMKNKAGNYGVVAVEGNELAEKAFSMKEGAISEPFEKDGGWIILKVNEILPAGQKTFEEAKPEVISLYQDLKSKELEDEYVKRLKSLYEPKFYYENLQKAFKPEPAN